ncbi:serine/threonine protein phosphatase [Candidatus Dependentiae bacterium]|nr:serine/threonine protein phosphatase [Candidatus Dependentiae bacterium]
MNFFLSLAILVYLTVTTANGAPELALVPRVICSSKIQAVSLPTGYSLKEWARKIAALKERPIELSTLPAQADYQKAVLNRDQFLSTITQCARLIGTTLSNSSNWINHKSLIEQAPGITNLQRPVDLNDIPKNFIFKPYAQRLIVAPNSTIALFGDLHGSIHSLMRDLLKLQELGFIDNNFKLKQPNFYMLFLGDYIDRGIYGVECFYTVARLKLANPNQVFLVRGNHEDYNISVSFKKGELAKPEKDVAPSFLLELQSKFSLTPEQEIMLSRFYDLLPVVVYIGSGTTDHINFMQCCHGGMELGYNPRKLLSSVQQYKYELIGTFARRHNFNTFLNQQSQNSIKLASNLDILCSEIQNLVFPSPYFTNPVTGSKRCVGFMWSDFYTNSKSAFSPNGDKRFSRWVYGRDLSHDMLSWGNSQRSSLKGVIRGHQHNNTTGGPMLDMICCSKGLVNVWDDNTVFTLISSPESKLENSGENCFTYDSFALLKPQKIFNNWKLEHYFQDTAYQSKSWGHKVLFFDTDQTQRLKNSVAAAKNYTRATTQALSNAAKKHQTEVR